MSPSSSTTTANRELVLQLDKAFTISKDSRGEVSLHGEHAERIQSLLEGAPHGTSLRLQVTELTGNTSAIYQLDLQVTSRSGKSPFSFALAASNETLPSEQLFNAALRLERVMRDGLPENASTHRPCYYNPMVTVWQRPLTFTSGWDALKSLRGALARVEFEFEGVTKAATGVVEIESDSLKQKTKFILQPINEGAPTVLPENASITLKGVQRLSRGAEWVNSSDTDFSISDIVELRSKFEEGSRVRVSPRDLPSLDGIWRGVDDRYRPLVVVETKDQEGKPIFQACPLSKVIRITHLNLPSDSIGDAQTIWHALSAREATS